MAAYGYKIYTFSVHQRRKARPVDRLRLGAMTGEGRGSTTPRHKVDALVALYGILCGASRQRIDERTKHLTVVSVRPAGRSIRFSTELGTSGQRSRFIDPQQGGQQVFARDMQHIESSPRRGLIVAGSHSTVGLIALESRAGSTGSSQIMPLLKRGFAAHTGLVIDFEAVVHEDALNAFLAQADINAVTLRRNGLPSDIADELEVRDADAPLGRLELKISRGRIPQFKRQLAQKFSRDADARQRLLSVGDLHFNEVNVKIQVGDRSTTLAIAANQTPSFVYQIRTIGEPDDVRFYREVTEMVPEVARAFGAIVGGDWQAGDWSEASREVTLAPPTSEESLDGTSDEADQ